MFEAYKIGVAISLTNHVSPVLATIARDFAKTNGEAALFQKRIEGIKSGLVGGFMTAGVGIALAAMFKTPIHDALEFERAMLRVKNIGGIDSKVLSGVREDALSGKYQGVSATQSVNLFRDLHAAFGEAEHAKEFMPKFVDMARITEGMYGKSALSSEEDVKALAKFAERRGGTKSPAAMESAIDTAMKIQNASGGAVTPKDLLAFTARMGAMGNQMSDQGILKMWALMQEQGGSKAGTSLNSALQNLVQGRGTEKAGFWLHEVGLVDEEKNNKLLRKIYGDKAGQHKNAVTANSLIGSDKAREDAVGWVEDVALPKILKYIGKQGITDPKKIESKVSELLSLAISNRLGADGIALIATQLPRILKDYRIAEESSGLAGSKKSYDESPIAKMQNLQKRWETALTHLGLAALPTVIPLVEKLSSSIESFSKYANENKETVKSVTGGILQMSIALVGLGAFRILINGIRGVQAAIDIAKSSAGMAEKPMGLASKALGLLGKVALVAQAAFIGWELGTWLNDSFIAGTKFSDWLGGLIAKFLGWIGVQDAQDAVNSTKAYEARNQPTAKVNAPEFKKNPSTYYSQKFNEQKKPVQVGVPTTPTPLAFKVENKLDMYGLTTKITQMQAKSIAGPQVGSSQFDDFMNMRLVGSGASGG